VTLIFAANFIYVYVNFERIAADQMKASMVDENYRFIVDGLFYNLNDPHDVQLKKQRSFGAVIGAFVGDAAGAVLEFTGRNITE
jgi:hypothetical protein